MPLNVNRDFILAHNGSGLGNRIKCIVSAILNRYNNPSLVAVRWEPQTIREDATLWETFSSDFLNKLHPDNGQHGAMVSTWRIILPPDLRNLVLPSTVNCWGEQGPFIDSEYGRIPMPVRERVLGAFSMLVPHPAIAQAAGAFLRQHQNLGLGIHVRMWEAAIDCRAVVKDEILDQLARIMKRVPADFRKDVLLCVDEDADITWFLDALQKHFPMSKIIRPNFAQFLLKQQQRAFAEVLILSKMPKLVVSRSSTFSEIAWWFGGARTDTLLGLVGRHHATLKVSLQEETEEHLSGIISSKESEDEAEGSPEAGGTILHFPNLGYCMVHKPGLMTHIDSGEAIARAAQTYASHYRGLMANAAPDDVMLDVGANIGLSSLPVASMGFTVFAFEALPENSRMLRQAVKASGNNLRDKLHIVSAAVSDGNDSELSLFLPVGRSDNCSLDNVAANQNVGSPTVQRIVVKSISLDQWWSESSVDARRIRLLKIDVQGGELAVLRGARRLIQACKPFGKLVIEFEIEPQMLVRFGTSASKVLHFLVSELGMNIRSQPTTSSSLIAPELFAKFDSLPGQDLFATCF